MSRMSVFPLPGAALCAVLLLGFPILVHAPPAAAQGADAEGCCQVPGACISPSQRGFCLEQSGGRFFAGHVCGGGEAPECVLAHPVGVRAGFQMSLDCGGTLPRSGTVALSGETKIARRDAPGGDFEIPIEIVSLELTGTPSTFGPMELEYGEPTPPSGVSDLGTGGFDGRLLDLEMELYEPSSCPPSFETAEPLPLDGSRIFSFPPVGGRVESPVGTVIPLVADGEPVGTLTDFSLELGEPEDVPECRLSAQPSATLLVPYFEVDLEARQGPGTLIDVTNDSDDYVLTRVALWTDLGVPTLTFWVYLSPGDVQTVNLHDLFAGHLPDTSAVLADPGRPVFDFDPCQPGDLSASLDAAEVAALQAAHTGAPLPAEEPPPPAAAVVAGPACAGIDRGDSVARGYVTLDVVRRCGFAPTVASYRQADRLLDPFELVGLNALSGNYYHVDGNQNFARGEAMIHRPFRPLSVDPGDETFYGRYLGFDASDGRLPLPGHYRSRFLQGGPFDGGTRLVVWRDNLSSAVDPIPCGTLAPWQPLGEGGIVAWDEDENAVSIESLATICPGAAGVTFACDLQKLPFAFGFLDLDFSHGDGEAAQAVVVPAMRAQGRFSVGQEAVPVDDRCAVPKAVSLQPFDQALSACEYEVIGFTDRCPHGFGDHIFVGCDGGRCALSGPQGHAAVALCPDRDCGLGLRLVSHCQVRTSGARYKKVEKCR